MGLLKDELTAIVTKSDIVVAKVAADMFAELIQITPVDTGQLKIAWDLSKTPNGWLLSNNLGYSSIIFEGRVVGSDGVVRGSEQLPNGLAPILDKYNRVLEIELRRI